MKRIGIIPEGRTKDENRRFLRQFKIGLFIEDKIRRNNRIVVMKQLSKYFLKDVPRNVIKYRSIYKNLRNLSI